MNELPEKLMERLERRGQKNALRQLKVVSGLTDFSSNDYLGFGRSTPISANTTELLKGYGFCRNGATGSRLLTGNDLLYEDTEQLLAKHYKADSALLFNSGYDANIGVFGSVLQRGDVVLFDELIHASIRDGIKLSNARAFKFRHNDLQHLKRLLQKNPVGENELYVVTESVFSMDGDMPDLAALSNLVAEFRARLVVDEAHAIGISARGMVVEKGLEELVFVRIVTFGKAIGCHGAAILGKEDLRRYLINFAHPIIYSTALPPHSVASIMAAHQLLNSEEGGGQMIDLKRNIYQFRKLIIEYGLQEYFPKSESPMHVCLISGNTAVKNVAQKLADRGFDVRPILSPTVPEGKERLRICLHSYNSEEELRELVELLSTLIR